VVTAGDSVDQTAGAVLPSGSADRLAPLKPLVLKSRVSLGGLGEVERAWALAVAAMRLRTGESIGEAEVNARLKACLAEEGAFLATDHVELRRWLVDTGWWSRDGFGRRYERVPATALREALKPMAEAIGDTDLPGWIAGHRQALQAERERRRQAHASAAPRTP